MQKLTIIGEQEEELKCDESDGGSNPHDFVDRGVIIVQNTNN